MHLEQDFRTCCEGSARAYNCPDVQSGRMPLTGTVTGEWEAVKAVMSAAYGSELSSLQGTCTGGCTKADWKSEVRITSLVKLKQIRANAVLTRQCECSHDRHDPHERFCWSWNMLDTILQLGTERGCIRHFSTCKICEWMHRSSTCVKCIK